MEALVVGEHNFPSPRTPKPRDQLKVHELIGDICQDVTLPSPVGECPWPYDDTHAEEEHYEQTPISPYPQNNESCLGWYCLIDVIQISILGYLSQRINEHHVGSSDG